MSHGKIAQSAAIVPDCRLATRRNRGGIRAPNRRSSVDGVGTRGRYRPDRPGSTLKAGHETVATAVVAREPIGPQSALSPEPREDEVWLARR